MLISDAVAQHCLAFADTCSSASLCRPSSQPSLAAMAAAAGARSEMIEVAPGVMQPITETELYMFLASLPGAKSEEFLLRAGGPLQSFDCAFCESCPCIVLQ